MSTTVLWSSHRICDHPLQHGYHPALWSLHSICDHPLNMDIILHYGNHTASVTSSCIMVITQHMWPSSATWTSSCSMERVNDRQSRLTKIDDSEIKIKWHCICIYYLMLIGSLISINVLTSCVFLDVAFVMLDSHIDYKHTSHLHVLTWYEMSN